MRSCLLYIGRCAPAMTCKSHVAAWPSCLDRAAHVSLQRLAVRGVSAQHLAALAAWCSFEGLGLQLSAAADLQELLEIHTAIPILVYFCSREQKVHRTSLSNSLQVLSGTWCTLYLQSWLTPAQGWPECQAEATAA